MPWLDAEVVQLLPTGVAAEAIRQAREAEKHPAAEPYFDALEAQLALRRGDYERALAKAEAALEKLPVATERLLRARAAAVGGSAAHHLGDRSKAHDLTGQALRDFPQVFRLLDVTIPVHVKDDGSKLAQRLSDHLKRSPRFRIEPNGFPILVSRDDEKLTMSLFRDEDDLHVEAAVPIEGKTDELIAAAFRRFHQRMMSPALDLTAVEINSVQLPVRKLKDKDAGVLGLPNKGGE
jgi:tetratricopeptide (TPR) repeat protein